MNYLTSPHRFSLAPMMGYSDRHFRYLCRLLAPQAYLYTEMVTASTLLHNQQTHRRLICHDTEHPVALQLGSDNPDHLASCLSIREVQSFDSLNLNVGCPSERVQSGDFGACLMARPKQVARCVQAMRKQTTQPITVKTRIGIDDQDSEAFLHHFIATVAEAGCETFIIHARKAWLQGLSPHQNRTIPPLNYERVYRLKQAFPELTIVINGGIRDAKAVSEHLQHCDGVMLGRISYQQPMMLREMHQAAYPESFTPLTAIDILSKIKTYTDEEISKGVPPYAILRHTLGLFHGMHQARALRQQITHGCRQYPKSTNWLDDIIAQIENSLSK